MARQAKQLSTQLSQSLKDLRVPGDPSLPPAKSAPSSHGSAGKTHEKSRMLLEVAIFPLVASWDTQ